MLKGEFIVLSERLYWKINHNDFILTPLMSYPFPLQSPISIEKKLCFFLRLTHPQGTQSKSSFSATIDLWQLVGNRRHEHAHS